MNHRMTSLYVADSFFESVFYRDGVISAVLSNLLKMPF